MFYKSIKIHARYLKIYKELFRSPLDALMHSISFQNKLDSILFPLSFVIDVFFDDSSVGSTIANSINITTNDYNQRPFYTSYKKINQIL